MNAWQTKLTYKHVSRLLFSEWTEVIEHQRHVFFSLLTADALLLERSEGVPPPELALRRLSKALSVVLSST